MKEEEIKKIINKSIQEYDMKRNDNQLVQLQDIFGNLKMIDNTDDLTNTLAAIPQNFYEQLFLDTTTTNKKLYIYDFIKSTWNKIKIDSPTIYHGAITYTGTAWTPLPTGWTVARRSGFAAGSYVITHSLGSTSYVVTAISAGQANTFISCQDRSNNSMILSSFDDAGDFTDADIFFTLIT